MADSLYTPDPVAIGTLRQPWDEAFRAQRDVGLYVPINYHTVPAVSLRAACFSTNTYEEKSFQLCFSNLLAIGLQRFLIDVYWDARRGEWSLCPVEIPPSGSGATSTVPTSTTSEGGSSTRAGLVASGTSLVLKRQDESSSGSGSTSAPLSTVSSSASSMASSSFSPSISSPSSSSSLSSSASASISSSPPLVEDQNPDGTIQLGAYNCTSTITLNYLTSILDDFLAATSTTTGATFIYLVLDIHAASSWSQPDEPAEQPPRDRLPSAAAGNLLSDIIKGNLSDRLYAPSKLMDQRAQLSDNWHSVADENMPREGYYRVQQGDRGRSSTEDGWPTEAYIQFSQFYRLIAVLGSIDPQMGAYNTSPDSGTLFSSDAFRVRQDVSLSSSGVVTSGCLFDASATSITRDTNSSFAFATLPSDVHVGAHPDLLSPMAAVSNLTACGLSPLLNHTLANVTADVNPLPYVAFTRSYLWSWAPGQPLNATDSSPAASTANKCAAAYPTGAYAGQWHVVDCASRLRVACQDAAAPYAWTISEQTATYDEAPRACPSPFAFSVPHTALENAHLGAAMAELDASHAHPILINLNSLDTPDCWVGEVNGTCPYLPPGDTDRTRIVVVPTVAAVIIFVCAALTFFVKCAANRREEKRGRRRRMLEGWEYEGVPS